MYFVRFILCNSSILPPVMHTLVCKHKQITDFFHFNRKMCSESKSNRYEAAFHL
uniref:Uncharacterized protein n=1 Tax=Anguilla anguilla TaxID=7936 RepID=A0A0E9TFJ8_ANGAN